MTRADLNDEIDRLHTELTNLKFDYDQLEVRAENAEATVVELREALWAVCHEHSKWYPRGCWCGACQNSPNYGGRHSVSCEKAQAAMGVVKDE